MAHIILSHFRYLGHFSRSGSIESSDRKKTPPVYSDGELKVFARMVNKLDRVFVDESSVIEYLKDEAKLMGLDELDTLTQIAFKGEVF